MENLQIYQVLPALPESLSFLETLSRNLWWSWKKDAKELFRRIDPEIWRAAGGNPVALLTMVPQKRLEQLAEDDSFLAHMDRVKEQFQTRVLIPPESVDADFRENEVIAYLSMEFGIHESLPLFAGGLGVLAGDHLKSASNLSIPLVGICLLYRKGYFRQYLDHTGWQQETYPDTDIFQLPIKRARDKSGDDLRISVSGPKGEMVADVWETKVGRTVLYLLDTNIRENPPEIRGITSRLYAGDEGLRLAQEVLLGIGGIRALFAMGKYPKVCHMNEGHSAFSAVERLAQVMAYHHVDLERAMEIVPRATVFTTHTPVAAGHDEFSPDEVRPYLEPLAKRLGTPVETLIQWGQPEGAGPGGQFSMFVLGLRLSHYCNGVSELHGQVARRMWAHVWPKRVEDEIPISHITNGIHVSSFISLEYSLLFEQFLGPDWYMSSRRPENVDRIDNIYNEDLWRAHERNRARLVRTCRELMQRQYAQRNAPLSMIEAAESVLDPDVLTIGFARRFATYKRATLLLKDPDRLRAMINHPERPVQFVFAGKAHPRDNEGKELIKALVTFAREEDLRHRVVFLEDYDMHLARHLVQGVDVWLNTPRRPYEACGTSGMKAAINGVLNLSILDGWWCEGYREDRGWAIGSGEDYEDPAYQDAVESQAIYNTLENDVIPNFYDRKNGEAPGEWIRKMKASMKMAMEEFCSLRMVAEYEDRFYRPAARRFDELMANDAEEAGALATQSRRLQSLWGRVWADFPVQESEGPFRVGDEVYVATKVCLGELRPDEVDVELFYGPMKSVEELSEGFTEPMAVERDTEDDCYLYACTTRCRHSGRYGYTVRVTPRGDDRIKFTPKLITWA